MNGTYGFGIIRLFLAVLVIFEHSFILGGFGNDPLLRISNSQISSAFLAVMSFFVISGFLITKSYCETPRLFQFGVKRVLRIMPGFWMCILIVAFGFAPVFYFYENGSLDDFLSTRPTNPFQYVLGNITLLIRHYSIGDILSSNPFPHVLNGSLWTLFLEAKAYILAGFLGFIGIFTRRKYFILVIYILLLGFIGTGIKIPHIQNPIIRLVLDHYFLVFLCYFIAGSVLYLYRNKIKYSWKLACFLFSILIISLYLEIGRIALPIFLPYIIILIAGQIPPGIFDKKIDLSYGLYIYSFPVMQGLVFFGLSPSQPILFVLSILFTIPLALCSWYCIERPALGLRKKVIFSKKITKTQKPDYSR